MRHPQLFDNPPPPRAKPRKLMHVIDAGPDYMSDRSWVRMACRRCGHEQDFHDMHFRQALRGVPCPQCNQ